MKLLIILICLCFVAAELNKDIVRKQCKEEVGWNDNVKFPNPKIKCFLRCYYEKMNVIVNDKIIPENFAKVLGPNLSVKYSGALGKCASNAVPSKDRCLFALQLTRCIVSFVPVINF